MPHISIRGVDHYYEWISAGDAPPTPGKPVMVFLHGWAGSGRYWRSTAEVLKEHFDCLIYDLRGFGQSLLPLPVPGEVAALGYELEEYAEDLALLLDALKLQQVYLNAHSTGASIAVFFLNLYPDRVKQAILTCHGVFEYEERAFKTFHKFGGYVVAFRPQWLAKIPYLNRLFMARFLHRSLPDADSRAFLEDFLVADYDAAIGTIYTAVSEKAAIVMPDEFKRLTVPTLLISGEYDQIIPVELGKTAAALSPQVQHVVLPKTAHFPMLEDAATYLSTIQAFLGLPIAYSDGKKILT